MDNTRPISKRSKRLLEEASRHLCFAERSVIRMSLEEYERLAVFCMNLAVPFYVSERISDAEYLGKAIIAYLEERGQP